MLFLHLAEEGSKFEDVAVCLLLALDYLTFHRGKHEYTETELSNILVFGRKNTGKWQFAAQAEKVALDMKLQISDFSKLDILIQL